MNVVTRVLIVRGGGGRVDCSMELISGALQKYRTMVRQRNIAQYDPAYPGIVAYFERVTLVMAEAAAVGAK